MKKIRHTKMRLFESNLNASNEGALTPLSIR